MTIKTPKVRHERFLEAGFFPPEMPSCFYSENWAPYKDALLSEFSKIPTKDPNSKNPSYYYYRSEKSNFSFPRFRREDRRHSYMNPIAFFFLSKVLADNYIDLRKLNRQSRLSIAPSIFDWNGKRALTGAVFEPRNAQNSSLNARFETLAEADINGFYHSVYTHTIAWAIHGKAYAKKHPRDYTLYGNVIDLLVRNGQGGQTIGIPVGPDTSRLIGEVVGSAIDRSIQKTLKLNWKAKTSAERRAMRFVDDYTVGCSSGVEADKVIATIREAVNSFELELNNLKTRAKASSPFMVSGWREHLREFLPTKAPFDPGTLNRYFYNTHLVARDNTDVDVVKYAIKAATRVFLETDSWTLTEEYLLSAYRQSATVLPRLVEILILRQMSRKDVSIRLITDFVNTRLPALADLQKNGEIVWLLFLCISLELKLNKRCVARLLAVEDGAIALLVSDVYRIGLIPATTSFAGWNAFLTPEGLDGPMWLYAYESTLKMLNGVASDSHVTSHPWFSQLLSRKIDFYRSGSDHLNAHEVLRTRLDNSRRKLMLERLEQNLGEDVDDFDFDDGDEQDKEDVYD